MSFLEVPAEELEKVKPEFRAEVKRDAEKCIKGECFAFKNERCYKQKVPVAQITISTGAAMGGYSLDPEKLVTN